MDLDDVLGIVVKKSLQEIATEVQWEIEHTYESVIDKFYAHYNPRFYDRTYATYLASSGYNNYTPKVKIEDTRFRTLAYCECGIEVNYKNILENAGYSNPYPNAEHPEEILERTFRGIHGFSPWEQNRYGLKGNYPKRMNPSPNRLMNKAFKKLTTQYHLAGITDKIIMKNLNKELGKFMKRNNL